jgi:hypothetical protein
VAGSGPRQRPFPWALLWLVIGIFVLSRLAFFLAGVRYEMGAVTGAHDLWQLLDATQLRQHLVSSLWNLHSQPPLLNLIYGVLLHLPRSSWEPLLVTGSLALGLGMVICVLCLCLELRIPRWASLLVVVIVVLDPAYVLFENWFFDTYASASFLTIATFAAVRFVRTRSLAWGIAFFACLSVVILLNSTFQWPWLLLAALPVVVVLRRHWKVVVGAAAVPILLLAVWYGKDAALFGTYSTSSWLGMNLNKITLSQAAPGQIAKLVAEHRLDAIATIHAFNRPAEVYRSVGITPHPPTGIAVLDEQYKSNGAPNYNNLTYIAIAQRYLTNDLRFIRIDPQRYVASVAKASLVFSVPPDQYAFLYPNERHIRTYVRAFDLAVNWQPYGTNPQTFNQNASVGRVPTFLHMSLQAVITLGLTIFCLPILLWRRRRDHAGTVALWLLWITTLYVVVVTTFIELGENNRFRMDLGPLPLIGSVVVILTVVRSVRGRQKRGPIPPARRLSLDGPIGGFGAGTV